MIQTYGYYPGSPLGSFNFTEAPLDFIADQLRSFSGISMDVRRHKTQLQEAAAGHQRVGHHVIVHANRSLDKAGAVVTAIREAGGSAEAVAFDVTDRAATAAAALVAAAAVGLNLRLAHQLRETPAATAVAVLQDTQARAAVLVTWDAGTRILSLKRLDATPLTADQALQLWALPSGGHPESLAVIGHQRAVRLTLAQPLAQVPALAVSIEPRGGSPDPAGPTGPVVFKGALIDSTL